jgi:predicted GNAT superfamily acetyltransferase
MQPTKASIIIRDLEGLHELQRVLELEKHVWELADADVTPLTLLIALHAAGSILVGAFDGNVLIAFALAFPSFEKANTGFHSHMLAVHPDYRDRGLGHQLKIAQRERALARGVKEMTWTFDPLRSRNAHLNFCRLGVVSNDYRADFYGNHSSSPLFANSTDRLWVTWRLEELRVEHRVAGFDPRPEVVDALRHLEPLVRFNGNGRPVAGDAAIALRRQRVAIEIPGDMDGMEREDKETAREWRLATRQAFTEAINAGFVVTEFCRSIRGQQGPGAYLLERSGY